MTLTETQPLPAITAPRAGWVDSAERVLWKGNEAIAEAAIQAGCDAYFGYPITPQAELLEWMARRMPELGRVFVQAESELGAITMALGAAATGARVMVSSSSPGISLMAEAMSYMAGSEVPMVLVDVMRGGPGLGSIGPSQSDYFQMVKGHGHGDYRVPVLAPASITEAMALVADAFEIAERNRTPVVILADGILGQAMEPVVPAFRQPERQLSTWQADGADGRPPRVVKSLHLLPEDLEAHNRHLQRKFARIAGREERWAGEDLDDAELVVVAYGTAARVARTAVARARAAGLRVGLFRPISLWPFPSAPLAALATKTRAMLVVELSAGQMVEDVRLAVEGGCPVGFHGRTGGMVPAPSEVVDELRKLWAITEFCRYPSSSDAPGGGDPMRIELPPRVLYQHPRALNEVSTHYCPGCGHGIVHRLLAELLDELDLAPRTIAVAPVGCSVFAYDYIAVDWIEAPHGRAPAVATGVRRARPDAFVLAYQGDGDLAAIGTGEIIHAAGRGERITTVFVNNGIYGMTGGQMAPTTPLGERTTSTPLGRDARLDGYPIPISEMLALLPGVDYVARGTVADPGSVGKLKAMLRRAFDVQLTGGGFALVEVLSKCPVGWGMSASESMAHLTDVARTYPVGVILDRRSATAAARTAGAAR